MPTPMQIRRFEPRDLDAVWDLHNRALEAIDAHGGNGEWDRDVTDPTTYYLENGGEFLVGCIGDDLVAMGAYMRHSDELVEIKRMRVEPAMHRRGFGKRILAELELRAVAQGYKRAFLVTTVQQKPAQALYSGAGYTVARYGQEGRFKTMEFEKVLV